MSLCKRFFQKMTLTASFSRTFSLFPRFFLHATAKFKCNLCDPCLPVLSRSLSFQFWKYMSAKFLKILQLPAAAGARRPSGRGAPQWGPGRCPARGRGPSPAEAAGRREAPLRGGTVPPAGRPSPGCPPGRPAPPAGRGASPGGRPPPMPPAGCGRRR